MKENHASSYHITVQQKKIEDEVLFVGTAQEFPDVAVYEENFNDAYNSVIEVIESLKVAYAKHNREFPEPATLSNDVSGRVTLRMTKSIHRKAVLFAEQEGVSLNHFLTSIIAESVGEKSTKAPAPLVVTHLISAQTAIAKTTIGSQPLVVVGSIVQDTNAPFFRQ